MYIFKPVFELSTELKIENKFENIIRIYNSPRPNGRPFHFGEIPLEKFRGQGWLTSGKKSEARSKFQLFLTRVQHGCNIYFPDAVSAFS